MRQLGIVIEMRYRVEQGFERALLYMRNDDSLR